MAFPFFQRVIAQVPRRSSVHLYNWGEPFLNPHLEEMVCLARKRGCRVEVHTNLSLPIGEGRFHRLVHTGVDLVVSCDGASQETYETYRRGGDFEMVQSNLRTLGMLIPGTGTSVTWKFIVNRHNEHETGLARSMATKLGVGFVLSPMALGTLCAEAETSAEFDLESLKREWLPKSEEFRLPEYRDGTDSYPRPVGCGHRCCLLWGSMVVTPTGLALPCCNIRSEAFRLGDLSEKNLRQVWWGREYRACRLCAFGLPDPHRDGIVCASCSGYKPFSLMSG